MQFLVFDTMMPDEPPLLFGECDEEQGLLRLSGRREDSWTSTVRSAIAQRGAPSDLGRLARLNPRFQVVLVDEDRASDADPIDQVDLIGGSSGITPGQSPVAPDPKAEVLAALRKRDPSEPAFRKRAPGAAPARRRRRGIPEGVERENE